MRLSDVLLVPWRSNRRPLCWLSSILVTACILGAVAIGCFVHRPGW